MRTLSQVNVQLPCITQMSAELSNLELGLELELNSDDVAAAEAAVAAHGDSLTCSCCDLELTDKESLHLHQISQHSVSQLSIALLSLRGFDMSSALDAEVPQDLCCPDSESESTVSAHSSFMLRFADELSNTVPQNETINIPDVSNAGAYGCSDTHCTSLSNAPQYPCDFPGTLSFGGNNRNVDTFGVDMNRNHQSTDNLHVKVGYRDAELRQSVSHNSFLTNACGMPKTSGVGGNQRQAAFFQEFHQAQETVSQQNNFPKTRKKRTQPSTGRQATNGESSVTPTASKKPKLTCTKPATRGGQKGAVDEDKCREFSCEICGRKYKRKSHLGRHIRMHTGVRPFPCTVCDKRFAVRSILKQHMRVHTGERPFKCLFCYQRFPQKSGLVTHMMLHTGKPYKCDLCDKSFVSNHKLSVHKKAHDEQNGRWPAMGPHSCPTCSTRFFTSSALAEHAKVHIVGSPSVTGTPQPVTQPTTVVGSVSDDAGTSTDVHMITHNSQEVTAGQALLTLMDSNGIQKDPALREEETYPEESRCLSVNSDNSEVPIDFEFCDVPLDLKSSIYLKEESFDFEDNIPNLPDDDQAVKDENDPQKEKSISKGQTLCLFMKS